MASWALGSDPSVALMTDEQTGTVVSYVRYADGTLLEVLTATPNESGRFGRKKWIHVVRVLPSSSSSSRVARTRKAVKP